VIEENTMPTKDEFRMLQKEWKNTEIKVRRLEMQVKEIAGLADWVGTIERRLDSRCVIENGRVFQYDAAAGDRIDITTNRAIQYDSKDESVVVSVVMIPPGFTYDGQTIDSPVAVRDAYNILVADSVSQLTVISLRNRNLRAENEELKIEIARLRKGESFADTT